jgi:acetylornithine deacetylase/succinyl-diaminopimelate desuccinylase-like protein
MAPMACPGFTDSHYLREAYGTIAYGYFPIKAMDTELATVLIHSANERVAVDDLELGVDMLRAAARELLG